MSGVAGGGAELHQPQNQSVGMKNQAPVYVVDDDHAAAASLVALLSVIGIKPKVFHTAEDFFDSFDGDVQGCLILDVHLPGMSGIELRGLMLKKEMDVPTIFISGNTDAKCFARLQQEGAVACLEKPYSGDDMCRLVQSVLERF